MIPASASLPASGTGSDLWALALLATGLPAVLDEAAADAARGRHGGAAEPRAAKSDPPSCTPATQSPARGPQGCAKA